MIINVTFSQFLSKNKLVDLKTLDNNFKSAEHKNVPLYKELVTNHVLSEDEALRYLAQFLSLEVSSLQINELNLELIKRFPLDKLMELKAIPIEDKEEYVAFGTSNPLAIDDVYALKSFAGKKIKIYLLSEDNSRRLLSYVSDKFLQKDAVEESQKPTKEDKKTKEEIEIDAPVIKLVDAILREAVVLGASDIHIEPFELLIRTRFRIDGVLREATTIPFNLFQAVLARIKIMANMNIAERRVPQDGKISMEINNSRYDFRVSTLPTLFGEKIVIRIYDIDFNNSKFSNLGFDKRQEELILRMITRPHGILLLTGPTGSGKSTTLYAFLRYLNHEDTNIITVEDPVENQIMGINQVQVNPRAEMTFSAALRSILRQDPNIIMIGEIRDEETAQIATRAAITGHLVLSTIHTNDAVGVVARLINMGIPRYLVADALLGSVSQRLIRKLCPHCKEKALTTKTEMQILSLERPQEIYHAKGCKYCNHSGYSGRMGLFEIMISTAKIRDAIMDEDITSEELENISNAEGKTTLLQEAREKVLQGLTTIEEYEKLSEIVDQRAFKDEKKEDTTASN